MGQLTCVEIYAGAGGLGLGLEQAGFVHEAAVELDPHACGTLRVNQPAWMIIEADVRSLSGGTFRGIDLFCGGMPSLERRAHGWRDPFPEALRLVAEIGPRAVLLESARDLVTSRFADYRGQVMERLSGLGYETWLNVVHASDHGVPQPRPRCVLVAIRPPWSRHFQWPEPSPVPPFTVGEVLYDLMSARGWPGAGPWRDRALRIAPTIAGGSAQGGPDLGPTRARQEWKALGIDGLGIADKAPGPDFPVGKPPRLTIPMVARLQGFPDDWRFIGRKTAAYRQISHAFPPPMARALGDAIRDALDETVLTRHMPRAISPGGWEARVRGLVKAELYDKAMAALADAASADPARAELLRLEFGFADLPDTDRRIVAGVWVPTAVGNGFGFPPAGAAVRPIADGNLAQTMIGEKPPSLRAASGQRPRRPPQSSGAALEQATADLLRRLFGVEADTPKLVLSRLRRQTAGTQFGHDISFGFECSAEGHPTVRCYVECKNVDHPIGLGDIAPKIMQKEFYGRGTQVDHWILISPHSDPTNELREMLDFWEEEDKYPFSVQIWSPESGIHNLFAIEPDLYQAIYGVQPSDDELAAAEQSAGLFRARLAPQLRIDKVWRSYLIDPDRLCFGKEARNDLDALFANHIRLKAASEQGAVLDGTLTDQVTTWINDSNSSSLLLLADFGEGKTVFTYCLARRLCEEFRRSPDDHYFPLRIPLRELREAGTGRALLERRLAEVGAQIVHWRTLTSQVRTLAILDGFDEMSSDLSPAAVTENLRGLESCLAELADCKILVTSRRRVLDGGRDRQRILDRLGGPQVLHIAAGPRPQRIKYLEQFAADEKTGRVLKNLRALYDPIGLTAKPLFLQMIRETLTELPPDKFDELILYETYIDKSLRRKIHSIQDKSLTLTRNKLADNLRGILEDVAVRLHQENKPYVYLRDQQGAPSWPMANLLWKDNQQAEQPSLDALADDDATARVEIRSLLKAVHAPEEERWPVDFFHRSMREYFVARAIVRYLHDDPDRARHILSAIPLLPEITHFASMRLKKDGAEIASHRLESFARSATMGTDTGYLGGNAITLFYLSSDELPRCDYSGLRLDHAQLPGADLTGRRFVEASLRYANLDNANLESADFTDVDLEGVQLDETSQVLALAVLGRDRIVAAYEDRSLRDWRLRPGAADSPVIHMLDHKAERLYRTPRGRLVALGDGALSVLDLAGDSAVTRSRFGTRSSIRFVIPGERSAFFAEELSGGVTRVVWLDVSEKQLRDHRDIDEAVTCCAQLDGKMYAFGTEDTVRIVWFSDDRERRESAFKDAGVSCLDLRIDQDGIMVATGHQDGTVGVTRVLTVGQEGAITPPIRHRVHSGTVTAISFGEDGQLISGGIDRAICVMSTPGTQPSATEPQIRRLCLTLRCRNVRFAGVRTGREQQKLREWSLK